MIKVIEHSLGEDIYSSEIFKVRLPLKSTIISVELIQSINKDVCISPGPNPISLHYFLKFYCLYRSNEKSFNKQFRIIGTNQDEDVEGYECKYISKLNNYYFLFEMTKLCQEEERKNRK